jgi:HAD superfamily 5'-nucleotidase-like hydrolase
MTDTAPTAGLRDPIVLSPATEIRPERGLFCNRTLNMRAIRVVGYDMDYTLVHYKIDAWERRAFEHVKARLLALGFPVASLAFDPTTIIRGLIIDTKLGNIVKANRFGYVKRAFHGTKLLTFEALRATYSREIVDLADKRWVFLNTLFSISEGCMFSQLVDLYDAGELPFVQGYTELYQLTRKHVDFTHMEGKLKAEIIADPDRFVDLDPDAALALLDQKAAQKQLVLITNSEWSYTQSMMAYAYDRFLPSGTTWRDLFDVVIVGAQKPSFFTSRPLVFEIVTPDGLLKPTNGPLERGKAYFGGNALLVEESLGVSGDDILYIGDHIWGDVNVTKQTLRWRTALIVNEIEEEIASARRAAPQIAELEAGMRKKEVLEARHAELRLALTRLRGGYGPAGELSEPEISLELARLKSEIMRLDESIAPLAKQLSELSNANWGPLMWAGNDKSHFARQVERHADVYTSRVSNFGYATPFVYLRSQRGTLPHDVSPNPLPADETAAGVARAPA